MGGGGWGSHHLLQEVRPLLSYLTWIKDPSCYVTERLLQCLLVDDCHLISFDWIEKTNTKMREGGRKGGIEGGGH